MPTIESGVDTSFLQKSLETGCEAGILYKLPWGIGKGRCLWVSMYLGEQCMEVSHYTMLLVVSTEIFLRTRIFLALYDADWGTALYFLRRP